MDEQAQAVEVRRRRNRAEVEQLVVEYEGSGLGPVEFCRRRGLSLSTLARYRSRRAQAKGASGSRWLAIEVSAGSAGAPGVGAGGGLVVALSGGRRIEIGRGFEGQTLMRLLGVLERS